MFPEVLQQVPHSVDRVIVDHKVLMGEAVDWQLLVKHVDRVVVHVEAQHLFGEVPLVLEKVTVPESSQNQNLVLVD